MPKIWPIRAWNEVDVDEVVVAWAELPRARTAALTANATATRRRMRFSLTRQGVFDRAAKSPRH
jgi:hypothetical protein